MEETIGFLLSDASRTMTRTFSARIAEHMQVEFAAFSALLRGPEAAEAVAAFQEKRKPDFSRFFAAGKA
ncbi:MAG: hypothetical protein EBT34_16080 [Acetobacteraceae bacterium]|nr:hypothetical protein [Acetobacteraceae bacterium]